MEYTDNEIIIMSTGIVSTTIAWLLGGRQKANRQTMDSMTAGAEKLVESTLKMNSLIETHLENEQKAHKNCREEVDQLRKEFSALQEYVLKPKQ